MNEIQNGTTAIDKLNPLYQEIVFDGRKYHTAHYAMMKHEEYCKEEGIKPQYSRLHSFIDAIKAWESTKEFVSRFYLVPLAWEGKRNGGRGVVFDPSWKYFLDHVTDRFSTFDNNFNKLYRPLFEKTHHNPILLMSADAQSQLFNHLNDYFSRSMAIAQSERAAQHAQGNPYASEYFLTSERQSRHVEYAITLDDGVIVKVRLRLPLVAWEIASAIRDIPLRRESNNNFRLPGWEIHDDIYPWLDDAVREVIRERKNTGKAGGTRHDTYAQHLDAQLWYAAILQMTGAMKLAYSLTLQKIAAAKLPPSKKKPYYKREVVSTRAGTPRCPSGENKEARRGLHARGDAALPIG